MPSDVTITTTNQIFGDEPWTQQSGRCGEKGDQIYLGSKSVEDDHFSEKFVFEWVKYRFGIFDINGFEGDPLYPPCGLEGHNQLPICQDASMIEASTRKTFPLGNSTHNRYFPSKHNFMCDRQDPIDIISRHEDFQQNEDGKKVENNQILIQPTFKYMKRNMTRYMVLIDDHIDISVRDSFQFLRDAMRKWIEKDLNSKETEVGIWMLGNASKSDGVDRSLIKPLSTIEDREEIFSILPWYIEHRGQPKCVLNNAIEQSISLMKERSKSHGDANNIVLIIAPGMFKCTEDVTTGLIDTAKKANVKILTLNYPRIGPNRIPMDILSQGTGGESFTIIEQKQNEEQSLLTTFFELTNTLMHISRLFNNDETLIIPTEIYRRKLVDTGSKEENKATSDSFNVDEATDFINFFIYIYDRRERNIEKGMKLISPQNHVYLTSSELRAEYHQLQIVGNLTSFGSWSYNIKRFFGNPQPHFVQVLAYPKPDAQNFIQTKAFVKKTQKGGPFIIYAQVMEGSLPIVGAFVDMSVSLNGRVLSSSTQLFDTGSGDPDVTRGDGIYTRYFQVSEPGMYVFQIHANDNGNTAYSKDRFSPGKLTHRIACFLNNFLKKTNIFLLQTDNSRQSCCGSIIQTSPKQPVTPFQRYLPPLTVFVDSEDIDLEKTSLNLMGRIGDLTWRSLNDTKVILEWSGPDVGRDNVKVDYEVRYATHLKNILDDFETLANAWPFIDMIPHNDPGQVTSATINLADEPALIGQPFFIAIKSAISGESNGQISNYVRVFIPRKRASVSPHKNNDMLNHDDHETDLSIEPSYESSNGIFNNITKLSGIGLEILIPIILCILAIIIVLLAYCWILVCRRRRFKSSKKKSIKSATKQQTSISVISPQPASNYTFAKNPNEYVEQMNGSMFQDTVPNHHTVGLPIDDDMVKPEYLDHDNILFEEMKHQQRQYQHQAVPYDHGDIMISSDGTLTRDGRFLSPFESWTASQLLFAHERRQSPSETEQPMYIDANGDLVPPIPRHPYQNNYDYSPGDMSRMPPPQYSTVYRPSIRSMGQAGSMQSLSETMSAEKKIRNVTMV